MKIKISQNSIDSLNAYRSALIFEKAANVIEREIGFKHQIPWFTPVIINSAFALEIFFKCLVMIEAGSRPETGIPLIKLFQNLSQDSQTAIQQYFSEAIIHDPEVKKLQATGELDGDYNFDFLSILNDINEAFVEWGSDDENSSGKTYFGIKPVFYAVNRRIRELKPEWTEEVVTPTT